MTTIDAKNGAGFARLEAKIDVLKADLDSKPVPPTIWQIAGVVGAGITALVAIAAYSSDRFDGGLAASSIVENAVQQIAAEQAQRGAAQDARIDRILGMLEDGRQGQSR